MTPSPEPTHRTSDFVCPLRQILRATVKCQKHITTIIVALLLTCGPTAILLTVRPIIVLALQRQPWWSRPHINVEIFKTISPAITDRDAPAAVMNKNRMFRVITSTIHTIPNVIVRRSSHAMRTTTITNAFSLKTSARLCAASSQRPLTYGCAAAAVAPAQPIPRPICAWSIDFLYYNQTTESLCGQVEFVAHG